MENQAQKEKRMKLAGSNTINRPKDSLLSYHKNMDNDAGADSLEIKENASGDSNTKEMLPSEGRSGGSLKNKQNAVIDRSSVDGCTNVQSSQQIEKVKERPTVPPSQ